MKKVKFLLAIVFIIGAFVIMQSSAPPPPGMAFDVPPQVETLEQTPPQLKHVWVKKLFNNPNATMLVKLELDTSYCYETITDTINIWWGDGTGDKITFYDNATHGDNIAADGIFSAYLTENVNAFRADVMAAETAIATAGGYIKFTGHSGQNITETPHFDATAFDVGTEVELHTDLSAMYTACEAVIREKSLFITDLSVVENPARTYNVKDNFGNPTGAWTFGELFKNMAGTSVSTKALLKSWLRQWTVNFTLNGQMVERRGDVIPLLIAPWIEKASSGTILASSVTIDNWEDKWDESAVTDYNLRIYAPFKLTAIVNRLDLRGNTSYKKDIQNSGETRFIFTLINYSGKLVTALDPTPLLVSPMGQRFFDWNGLNVIFEYGNSQSSRCDIKSLAEKWYGLSSLVLGSDPYNEKLQEITDYVTATNAAPLRPNGSAINRIRTNEKLFYETEDKSLAALASFRWNHADWEFRQFELDESSHLFKQVPLTNVPINYANFPNNLSNGKFYIKRSNHYNGSLANRIHDVDYPFIGLGGVYGLQNNTYDWAINPFVIKNLERGNHNMATTYKGLPLLAASTVVLGEAYHYWDLVNNFPVSTTSLFSAAYPELRHQLSLNTCEGCHSGETKTIFTQIQPLEYYQPAKYWIFPPDHKEEYIEANGVPDGETPININATLYSSLANKRYYQNVSAFLTGSSYNGLIGSPVYDDDNSSDADDNNMDGLYYVNNPAHTGSGAIVKYGYNDLLRRRNDLCGLINTPCTEPHLINIVRILKQVPFPLAGH